MPPRPKRQHYVTRAYLERFLESGPFLFCYGRQRGKPFQGQPSELAHERSYYSFRRPDGSWDDSLEHKIEQQVESPGLDAMAVLASGDTRLGWAQRDALAMLMAVQRFRVPHMRELLDAAHAGITKELLNVYERMQKERGPGRLWIRNVRPVAGGGAQEGPRTYVTKEDLEEFQKSLSEDPGQFSRDSIFRLAGEFANLFRRMKWTVHYSNGKTPFITSDCPVLLRHEREDIKHAGIIRPDSHIEFPLSRTSLLSLSHDIGLMNLLDRSKGDRERRRILSRLPEIRIDEADEEQVRGFNVHQAQYCSRWVFCAQENDWLVELLRQQSRNVRQRIVRDGEFIRFESLTGHFE